MSPGPFPLLGMRSSLGTHTSFGYALFFGCALFFWVRAHHSPVIRARPPSLVTLRAPTAGLSRVVMPDVTRRPTPTDAGLARRSCMDMLRTLDSIDDARVTASQLEAAWTRLAAAGELRAVVTGTWFTTPGG